MNKKEYADILKFALRLQIDYIEEDMEKPFANYEYLEGMRRGLEIAMEKIDASAFLTEN